MFGAHSPKLTRLIIEELKKEDAFMSTGQVRGCEMLPSDLASEEIERKERVDAVIQEEIRLENAKKAKDLYELRQNCCKSILNAIGMFGVVLIMPHCKNEAPGILQDRYDHFKVRETNKIKISEEILEELQFFSKYKIPEDSVNNLLSDVCLVQLIKPQDEVPDIEGELLRIVYGDSGMPPGDPDSPAYTLTKILTAVYDVGGEDEGEEAVEEEEEVELIGLWTPENAFTKAMALKFFFPKHSEQYIPVPPEATPPYVACCFDAFKRHDVLPLMEMFPKSVMRYGFFTSDNPDVAQLIAKSNNAYEKRKPTEAELYDIGNTCRFKTINDLSFFLCSEINKIVLQLSKKSSEAVLAFANLGPSHMSSNIKDGKYECKLFFPEDYDEPEPVEEEVEEKPKKKKKGKKASKTKVEEEEAEIGDMEEEAPEIMEGEEDDADEDEGEDGDAEDESNEISQVAIGEPLSEITGNADAAADKATSPEAPTAE